MRSRHVSVVINAEAARVYDFAAEPDNLPRGAAGLARSEVVRRGDELLVESPMGTVTVRFVPRNALGVVDHEVVLPTGDTVLNPLRVLAHPEVPKSSSPSGNWPCPTTSSIATPRWWKRISHS